MKRLLLILAFLSPGAVGAVKIGVNTHLGLRNTVSPPSTYNRTFQVAKANGLTHMRLGANLAYDTDSYAVSDFRAIVNAAKANGVTLEVVLALPFGWGDRTDHGKYPKGDAAALYAQGYNRTYNFVSQFAHDVRDWELQNEVNLLATDSSGARLFGKGMTTAEFNTSLMNDYASLFKGMSDAIDRINAEKGTKLRRIVGTTSSMFGFIDFMLSKGVKIDILGYHYYEPKGTDPTKYWLANGSTFNLFTKMASYKRPVHVNELNCAEIYRSTFNNVNGSATMQTCADNLKVMLNTFTKQTTANIETIHIYELLDEPGKASPENRFGLMFNLDSPKQILTTVSTIAKSLAAPATVKYLVNPVSLKVGVAATITPSVTNFSGSLNCQGVLLPPGMTINASTCVVSGKPTTAGTYTATIIAQAVPNAVNIVQFNVSK